MYCAAAPASTTTRNSAACTTLLRAHDADRADDHRGGDDPEGDVLGDVEIGGEHHFLPFLSAPTSSGSGLGHGLHPLAELVLVVQQVGDAGLGVLVLGAPEQRVERAHLDADAAVHAQRVVDVEAVEHADACGACRLHGAAGACSLWPSM